MWDLYPRPGDRRLDKSGKGLEELETEIVECPFVQVRERGRGSVCSLSLSLTLTLTLTPSRHFQNRGRLFLLDKLT